jgi:1-deoxy-D-xylulose-5-phosphate synthase
MINTIPLYRPNTPLLDGVDYPHQLRQLSAEQLPLLAEELRAFLLFSVGQTGGHFGAGLGVVELTIALHYCYQTPDDRLVWDVGHQTYPHKILTGRRERMSSLRQQLGLKGFPSRDESLFDTFGVGHSSTSISAALGMALAQQKLDRHTVAVIGDGAMTAGMAFEALNHAAHLRPNMLVVLNDNRMSISENIGGLSNYFARIWASRTYNTLREGGKKALKDLPYAMKLAKRTEEHMKGLVSPGTLFEELGFNYIGPIDGHNLPQLIDYFERIKLLKGPQLLHVVTQKGKGYAPAELDPVGYHALSKIEPKPTKSVFDSPVFKDKSVKRPQKYSQVFGDWLCQMAALDERLIAITPAMREGSGMVEFSQQFPDRYFDVAIAEQHSVTFAAGLACEGYKPVVAIYSTFLQRAYDQLIHDVAIQNLDVLFAIDRAGLVGQDGATHAGSFDLSFLRCIPNLLVMAPSDEQEARLLLYTGYCYRGPAAVRYPRGHGIGADITQDLQLLPIGKALLRKEGQRIAILAFGSMVHVAMEVAESINASVIDMRFVKPLDQMMIKTVAANHQLIVTLEENVIAGGAGSAVNEYLMAQGIVVSVLNLGLPDQFIEQGQPEELLADCGLHVAGVLNSIQNRMQLLADSCAIE